MKQIKCKNCKFTYDKRKKECPYCHTKHSSTTNILIIIALLIIVGIVFCIVKKEWICSLYDKFNPVKINSISIAVAAEERTINVAGKKIINLKVVCNNTSKDSEIFDIKFKSYCDSYELTENNSEIIGEIAGDSQKEYIYVVRLPENEDWTNIDVYCYSYAEPEEQIKIYSISK